jgi:hypothetical protein
MCHGSRSVRLRGDVSLRMMKLLTIIPSPMTNFVAPNHQHRQTPNALGEYGRSRSSRGESLVLRRTCSREQLALVPVNFIFYKSFQTWTLWTSLEALPVLAKLSGLRLAEFWVQGVGEEEAIQGVDRLSVPVASNGSRVFGSLLHQSRVPEDFGGGALGSRVPLRYPWPLSGVQQKTLIGERAAIGPAHALR